MEPLLSAKEMREVDRHTTVELAIPEIVLMEHAALAIVDALAKRFGNLLPDSKGLILSGPGNNGGDACAVGRLLVERGCKHLFIILVDDKSKLSDSTNLQLNILGKLGIAWGRELSREMLEACDWVVDGLFGTGLTRALEGKHKEAVQTLNAHAGKKWVVSIDVPSGLSADTGNPIGECVKASETVTLGFFKRGLVTGRAADYVGRLSLASIQIPRQHPLAPETFLYGRSDAARIPARRPASHKGDFGQVYVWASESDKAGASALSVVGALRAGAGLVTLVGEKNAIEAGRAILPVEAMTSVFSGKLSEGKKNSVYVFGPGMGTDDKHWKVLQAALKEAECLVLDADSLSLLAAHSSEARTLIQRRQETGLITILTPHPKEASRLLDTTVDAIELDRYAAVKTLSDTWHCTVLLKGKGTLIRATHGPVIAVCQGDSGLSKGGTGDLLSGVIAGLLAQQIPQAQAIPLAAYLHGRASELLSQSRGTSRSSLASEIADQIPAAISEAENESGC
jgi:ADP-dependent NAD(P)H-hydrate dehydratase / NAD(P)H-hydrate epimerase